MNKSDFLALLEAELGSLDITERQDALEYYREYFEEAGSEDEQRVIQELGSPQALANQIKAAAAVKLAEQNPKSGKKSLKAVWMVIGAIFAAPIALPLALVLAALVIVLLLVLIVVLICFYVVAAAFGVMALMAFISMLLLLVESPPTALMMLGVMLASAGLGGLVLFPTMVLSRWSFRKLAGFVENKLVRRKRV